MERSSLSSSSPWMTSFIKQCFVVSAASLNLSQRGMVIGYVAALLPQLQAIGSALPLLDAAAVGSWIASLPGIGSLLGNVTVPTLMDRLGRRKANIISIVIMILGWSCLIFATDLILIFIGRTLQGISYGMSTCLIPIIIGEYTSPRHRGAFNGFMSFIMAVGSLTVHAVGFFVSWKMTALICTLVAFVDLMMVTFSPETPSWLASQGKVHECQRNFRWLRGTDEEAELKKMIEVNKVSKGAQIEQNHKKKVKGFFKTLTKKEFYKPILIMIHVIGTGQWSGINILSAFTVTLVDGTVGTKGESTIAVVISLGIQRIITCICSAFIIRKLKRRTMLFTFVGANVTVLLATAGYIHSKDYLQMYNHVVIGGILVHLLMATAAITSAALPSVIAGEIFALRYRSSSVGISALFDSINTFLFMKTYPYLVDRWGVDGACCVYAAIVGYCLVVLWFILPDTKDMTLQEIEEQFAGRAPAPLAHEGLKSMQPLTLGEDSETA